MRSSNGQPVVDAYPTALHLPCHAACPGIFGDSQTRRWRQSTGTAQPARFLLCCSQAVALRRRIVDIQATAIGHPANVHHVSAVHASGLDAGEKNRMEVYPDRRLNVLFGGTVRTPAGGL